MKKETALNLMSVTGFLMGCIGMLIAILSFFNLDKLNIISPILSIILGIAGFFIILKTRKEMKDDLVNAGIVMNPLSMLLGIVQLIIYFVK